MHDGEDRFKEKLRHIDPLRLHVLDWIKDDTDNESPNDLAGLHHLVEDGLVLVLFFLAFAPPFYRPRSGHIGGIQPAG